LRVGGGYDGREGGGYVAWEGRQNGDDVRQVMALTRDKSDSRYEKLGREMEGMGESRTG